jgi:uncharacterized protein YjiS (DUF1127 family)
MKRFYVITIIAIVVTTSIATHLLAVGALSPTTPITGAPSLARVMLDWFWRYLDYCISAVREYREYRQAAIAMRYLDERMLKDIGLYRDGSVYDLRLPETTTLRR